MATTKRSPVPGEADKLIAHQARLLKAPRIAEHYHRLAEQGREANWSLEYYLAAVLTVESNARSASGARQRIRYAGFPAIKTITDFDFTAQPAVDRAQIARLEAGGWLAEARNIVLLGPTVIEGSSAEWVCSCSSGRCCDRCNVRRRVDAAAGQFAP